MAEQSTVEHADGAEDAPPTGPRRILIALYLVFAVAATARGIVQIATKFDEAPLAYVLSLLSGIVYIAAAIGLITDRRWSRPLAWVAVGTEMVGVLVVGCCRSWTPPRSRTTPSGRGSVPATATSRSSCPSLG